MYQLFNPGLVNTRYIPRQCQASNGIEIKKDLVSKLIEICGEDTDSTPLCFKSGINATLAANDLEGTKKHYENFRRTEMYHRIKPNILAEIELAISTLEAAQNTTTYK